MTPELQNQTEAKKEPEVKKNKKRRIAIVDSGDIVESQAKDIAEDRLTTPKTNTNKTFGEKFKDFRHLKMSEKASAVWEYTKNNIWKGNLAREYYRQKEYHKAKDEIKNSGNIYVGENNPDKTAHDQAMAAIVDRFVSEYDEAIHTEAGEERNILDSSDPDNSQLNSLVRSLIRSYAENKIDDKSFSDERNKILSITLGLKGKELTNTVRYTDNLLQIAKEAKLAIEHGASIDEIDQEVEIIVGKAKAGVRTEAKMNTVDKIIDKMHATGIGRFVNETTVATGVAIAYSVATKLSQRLASSKAFAIWSLGGSVALSGVIAGAKESVRITEERKQHSRERAKGKEMTPDMKRRVELESAIYKTVSSKSLCDSIKKLSDEVESPEDYFSAVNALSEAESRIRLSDKEKIDLISYSDYKSVEQERLNLDVIRAEAKIKLRHMVESGDMTLPGDQTFDEFYASVMSLHNKNLYDGNGGIDDKDRIFKKLKVKKIAGAVTKGVVTGFVIGGMFQEVSSFFHADQQGLIEHAIGVNKGAAHVTAFEGIRQWFGHLGQNNNLHEHISGGTQIGQNNNLQDHILGGTQINGGHTEQIAHGILSHHPKEFVHVHRHTFFDNNTKVHDHNELGIQYGGVHNTGIINGGHGYDIDVSHMTNTGSFHAGETIKVKDLMIGGQLKMLFSLSSGTQHSVVELPIGPDGHVRIDPDSFVGKNFFTIVDGHAQFTGRFMEVAQVIGTAPDGNNNVNIIATELGSQATKQIAPIVDFSMSIPMFGRALAEKMRNPITHEELSYTYNGFNDAKRENYLDRMSKDLRENPDAELNEKEEINNYLSRQSPEDIKTIDELAKEAGPMDSKCRLSVCIPVAGHQEGKNIYKTLGNYLNQTAKKDEFEIVLFVNQPEKDYEGKNILPDDTAKEIQRFKKDHPELHIRVMHKVFPIQDAKIGNIRKYLTDAVLERHISRGKNAPKLAILSNDADNEGIATQYIDNFIRKFEKNPETDAYMGQLDWGLEAYARNPLVHIGTRFFQYVDVILRRGDESTIASSGANFAFQASIYAAVNGYSRIGVGEDVDLGRAIKGARRGAKNKRSIDFAGPVVSRLITSTRRAEEAIKRGLSPIEQWDKFGPLDELRTTNFAENNKEIDYDNPEVVKKLVADIEIIINRTLKTMTWVSGADNLTLDFYSRSSNKSYRHQQAFRSALGWLGINKYEIVGPRQIKIIDARNLIDGLKRYRGDVAKILKKKLHN